MRVDRLLSILLIILNKKMVTGKQLSEHFEVSLRTIYRDIDKLCEAGVPIASSGGTGGGYYIMENYKLDKSFFNKNEIKPLLALMNNLQFLFGKNAQFNDLAIKFESMFEGDNDELIINISHFSMEEELKEGLYVISKAIEDGITVEFDYINRRSEYSRRLAEPLQISYRGGDWYMLAFCTDRKDYRKFKLIRIRNIRLGTSYTKRNIPIKEIQSSIDEGYYKNSIRVLLRFTNKIGEHLNEHFVKDRIKRQEDGNFLVEEYYPHEEGLIKFILSFGKDCEVLEPDYLKGEITDYLEDLYRSYRS